MNKYRLSLFSQHLLIRFSMMSSFDVRGNYFQLFTVCLLYRVGCAGQEAAGAPASGARDFTDMRPSLLSYCH